MTATPGGRWGVLMVMRAPRRPAGFHFGGSTHCLLFRGGVRLAFDLHGQTPGTEAANIDVNARIATVLPS